MIEYIFPISFEMNCLYSVLALISKLVALKIQNTAIHLQLVYIISIIYECFNVVLNRKELTIERSKVHVFDREW